MGPEDVDTKSIAPRGAERQGELERGTFIGRYVILDRLGAGGMGIVYRAYDPDLDRRVALKLVRDLSDDTTARLIREAKALAKVSHPNIVQIFDVGVFGDTVFIAMELVEGRTLADWRRETEPTWRPLLAHLIEAGRGLAAAHAAGLVHRDFKPQNVIVGADGRVRVLDFGLARQAGEAPLELAVSPSSADESLDIHSAPTQQLSPGTFEGTTQPEDDDRALPRLVLSRITGTPVYMAPEQRRPGTIDARADQFAFAVTSWELLLRDRPFEGHNAKLYAVAAAKGKFRAPPAGNPTPTWVRRVLLRALAAQPSDRYRSMDDVLAALAADPARRRRNLAAIGLGVVALGAIVVAIATRGRAPGPCEDAATHLVGVWDPSVAAKLDTAFAATGASFAAETAGKLHVALDRRADAWKAMHTEACRATRVSGEQSTELLDLRMGCLARRRDELAALVAQLVAAPDAARVAASIEAVGQLPAIAACADREALTAVVPIPTDPTKRTAIDAARTELSTIHALLLTGQWPAGRARAEALQARAAAIDWAPLVAEVGLVRGQLERHAGSFATAEVVLTETVKAAARAHVDDVATSAWSELAWVVGYELSRPLEGLAYVSAAEAAALRTDASPIELANIAHTRALIWSTKGDQAAALREAERALAIVEHVPDAGELEAVDVLNTIAMIESTEGNYGKAEHAHRQVLARRRAALGEGHPKVADSIDNLGVVMFHQGKYDEARRDYEQALALRLAALGPDARDVGTSHNNLGGLLMETGDDAGAAKHLEAALRIYEATLGHDHGDLAIPLSNLGELATRRGDFAKAIAYCERALGLDQVSGPDDPKLAYDLVCVGEARLGLHQPARDVFERALALREANEGDLGELARTRFGLARALWPDARARPLAIAARDGFATAGDAWKPRLAEAIAWLRTTAR